MQLSLVSHGLKVFTTVTPGLSYE